MFSTTFFDQLGLCRLCLINERVEIPIFEVEDLSSKINVCLPVKVEREDKLPKSICVDCFCKLESFYQFHKVTAQAQEQLLFWLSDDGTEVEIKVDSHEDPESEDIPKNAVLIEELTEPIKDESAFEDFFDYTVDINEDINDEPTVETQTMPTETKKIRPRKISAKRKEKNVPKSTKQKKIGGVFFSKKLGSRNYACTVCDERFNSQEVARQHYRVNHVVEQSYKCDQCDKIFKNLHPYKLHRLEHGIEAKAPVFWCDQCDFGTAVKIYLRDHKARIHSNERRYNCDYCGRKYNVKADLIQHLSIHEDGDNICEHCGKVYNGQKALARHLHKKHLDTYKYKCTICYYKFANQAYLDAHMKDNHDPVNPLKCDECGQTFKVKIYLTRHVKRVHQKLEKLHLCQVCGKSFVCANTYRIHYLTHTNIKPYKCNICDNSFSQRTTMMMHWRKRHPGAVEQPPPIILSSLFESLGLDKGLRP